MNYIIWHRPLRDLHAGNGLFDTCRFDIQSYNSVDKYLFKRHGRWRSESAKDVRIRSHNVLVCRNYLVRERNIGTFFFTGVEYSRQTNTRSSELKLCYSDYSCHANSTLTEMNYFSCAWCLIQLCLVERSINVYR